MSPQERTNDESIDDDAELLALEKILCEAEEQEKTKTPACKDNAKTKPKENIDDDAELLALDKILAEAEEEADNSAVKEKSKTAAVPRLKEDSTFADAFSYEVDTKLAKKAAKEAESRMEEVDSSDDEEVRNFLERKYNEYGSDVNKKLKQQNDARKEARVEKEVDAMIKEKESGIPKSSLNIHIKNQHNPVKRQSLITNSFKAKVSNEETTAAGKGKSLNEQAFLSSGSSQCSVYMDPVFGLRIINPLISSSLLKERMAGRQPVAFATIARHIQTGDLTKDWVIGGVLTHKGPTQKTKKDKPFCIWRLSDLRGEIKTVSLFLFGSAYKDLWKTAQGTCLAVLNPTVFEKRSENTDVACLSIDTAAKVMILGQSKDLGACKAVKRNGEICNALVNLSECDTCVFHVKQEFSKMSKRSELQSANAGRGLQDLRNKVLGKSEVFYGGQSYTAVPAKKSAKLSSKDNQRLSNLSEYAISPFAGSVNHESKPKTGVTTIPYAAREGPVSKIACNVEAGRKQRLKDLERLQILQAESAKTGASSPSSPAAPSTPQSVKSRDSIFSKQQTSTPAAGKQTSPTTSSSSLSSSFSSASDKFKNREFSFTTKSPTLSKDNFSLEVNIGERRASLAKQKALEILKKKPIQKIDPNSTRGTREGKRRAIDDLNEKFMSNDAKKQKLDEEEREKERKSRIQRIMDATSSHTNLIDMREREEQEKYFSKLEKKEALEEKMLSTYKMACKAVICKTCKYTAFSAAERCKQERHPLKVVDAEKRFFQCKDCGNRTVSVFRLPKTCCSNCNGSRWERCAMIRERKVATGAQELSVRGDEEMFIGSISGKANLNLAVPDD
ncbi:protein MCM10 homolog [Musca domestica]|uniref:Protein MCM10 homolog n=1 Tax=Musca domestica TaxID=7370 RepID=A0A1I8M363_MUSDO|nr:protein MCM10 homolog [Musca domestica]